jgi:hypothetical protein
MKLLNLFSHEQIGKWSYAIIQLPKNTLEASPRVDACIPFHSKIIDNLGRIEWQPELAILDADFP